MRLRYWRKLTEMKPDRIPRMVYEQSRKRMEEEHEEGQIKTKTWCDYTKRLLEELGMEKFWRCDKTLDEEAWAKLVKEKIHEREEKRWREQMKEKSKLRTYILVKQDLKQEEYLHVRDRCGVPELTKLRGGTNRLKIEKGRYEKLPPEQRVCEFCDTGEIEDEKHFLLSCPLYRELRAELWKDVIPLLPQPLLLFALQKTN